MYVCVSFLSLCHESFFFTFFLYSSFLCVISNAVYRERDLTHTYEQPNVTNLLCVCVWMGEDVDASSKFTNMICVYVCVCGISMSVFFLCWGVRKKKIDNYSRRSAKLIHFTEKSCASQMRSRL